MNKLGLIELRNSSLTQSLREFEKSSFDRPLVLSHSDFSAQPTNLAQDTRIAYAKSVEFSLDSTLSTQETNSSIFDEKSGLRSCERGNKTDSLLTKRTTSLPDLSQKDAEFVRLWA